MLYFPLVIQHNSAFISMENIARLDVALAAMKVIDVDMYDHTYVYVLALIMKAATCLDRP